MKYLKQQAQYLSEDPQTHPNHWAVTVARVVCLESRFIFCFFCNMERELIIVMSFAWSLTGFVF
jgi:hypothetical protein